MTNPQHLRTLTAPAQLPSQRSGPGKHAKPRTLPWAAKAPLAVTALAAASVAGVMPATAASLPPHPVSPRHPAANVDPLADYVGQNSCDPQAQPGTKALLQLVLQHYQRGHSLGIVRSCGVGGQSEHKEGRAFDWGLNASNVADKAAGDSFAQWVSSGEGARQLGVMYIIWNKRIWSAYRADEGWRPYVGASPHTDHIHLSMSWAGATQRTSFWTGRASTQDFGPCQKYLNQPAAVRTGWNARPCPIPLPAPVQVSKRTYWLGQSGADVKLAQQRLGIAADGAFGAGTRSAVMAFQRRQGLPLSGALDALTWARLVPSTVTKYVVVQPKPQLPEVSTPVPTPTQPTPTPTSTPTPSAPALSVPTYAHLTLQLGSQGAAVLRVQQVVGMPTRLQTGYYGPMTQAQVAKFQKLQGLTVDGVVGDQTWAALRQREVVLVRSQLVRAEVASVRAASAVRLREGSRGPAVRVAQRALGVQADGVYGVHTRVSVWRLQRSVGLPRTGVVDARTWAAIEHRVRLISTARAARVR